MLQRKATLLLRSLVAVMLIMALLAGCGQLELPQQDNSPIEIPVYVYHKKPPLFYQDSTDSLAHKWFELANSLQREVVFIPVPIDRVQLNQRVAANKPTVILWASQSWFERLNEKLYVSDPLFWDAEVLVSLSSAPLDSLNKSSLLNRKYGLRQGRVYPAIDKLVESGKAQRIDVLDNQSNYDLLKEGSYDAYVDSRSTVLFQRYRDQFQEDIHVAAHGLDTYSRRLVVTEHFQSQLPEINRAISLLKSSAEWNILLKSFGLEDLVEPIELDLDELQLLEIPDSPE